MKVETDVRTRIDDICKLLAPIHKSLRNSVLLKKVRQPFMAKLELSGLSQYQAVSQWGIVLGLLQQHPDSGITKQVRTRRPQTATESVLALSAEQLDTTALVTPENSSHAGDEIFQPCEVGTGVSAVEIASSDSIVNSASSKQTHTLETKKMDKKKKKKKKNKNKKNKKKKNKKRNAANPPRPELMIKTTNTQQRFPHVLGTGGLSSKKARTSIDQGPGAGSTVSFNRPAGSLSHHMISVRADPLIRVVAVEAIPAGTLLGQMSGVIANEAPESEPFKRLHNGRYLILGTSRDGGISSACISTHGGPANAFVDEYANVWTSMEVPAGSEIIIDAPDTRPRTDSADVRAMLHTVASGGYVLACGSEETFTEFEVARTEALSSKHYRSFMTPYAASQYACVARVTNLGSSTGIVLVNGMPATIPPGHCIFVPADTFIRTDSDGIATADIIALKALSLTELVVEDYAILPEPVVHLRALIPELGTHTMRPRSRFPIRLDFGPLSTAVEVRTSTLEGGGDGLFATERLPEGSHITTYFGQVLHQSEWASMSSAYKEYGAAVPNDTNCIVDGRVHFHRGLGRFTNQAKDASSVNAAMRWVKLPLSRHDEVPRGYISLYAKHDIEEGEEIFMNYGVGHVFNNC
jgi:hypothetical protein